MQNKNPIIIIAVLSVLALGLGYWYGLPKEGSGGGGGGGKEPDFLKKGLVAYYPFNGNAKDESGNGNDGEVKGAAFALDRHGNSAEACLFAGKNTIDCNKEWADQIKNRITLSAWMRPSFFSGWGMIVNKDPAGATDGAWFLGINNEQPSFCINGVIMTHNTELSKEIWHHIAGIYDGKLIALYVDGMRVATKQVSLETREISPTSINVHIGSSNGSDYFFIGQIDDVRIYNRALSEAEVKELYEFEKVK
jgi:hypothetical protein